MKNAAGRKEEEGRSRGGCLDYSRGCWTGGILMQSPNLRHSRFWSGFRLASVALVALPWKILEIRFREGRESVLKVFLGDAFPEREMQIGK